MMTETITLMRRVEVVIVDNPHTFEKELNGAISRITHKFGVNIDKIHYNTFVTDGQVGHSALIEYIEPYDKDKHGE